MCKYQKLDEFVLPPNFRGRSALIVQLWWVAQSLLFATSPQFMYSWRNFLLRIFGAHVGKNVIIRPSVRVTYPWKVRIADNVWIGDHAELYSLAEIEIGANTVISQRSYLCAADHDYKDATFPIQSKKIKIGEQVWVATDVFVAPGVTIHNGAVIGARSSVFKDMPSGMVCLGSPCKPIKPRIEV